jgi:ADP-heptose:LPS heptosyltransferase
MVLIRKLKSALTRLKQWAVTTQHELISQIVSVLTEKCWLIDYLPTRRTVQEHVLLVRLDLIGDFIIWLDSAKTYRQLYPHQKIVLYANSIWAELAQQFNYWDEVVPVDVPKLRANDWFRFKQLVELRSRRFEVAIQPTFSREYVADLCIRGSRAQTRLGHLGNLSNMVPEKKVISDCWYTQLIDLRDKPEVELNLNAAFVRALGLTSFQSALPEITQRFELPEHLKITEPYFVIAPGASWAPKMWPAENFAEVAREIHRTRGLKLVLCGTPAERHICHEVETSSGLQAINLAGQTTLCDMVEILRNAQLLVANDSAAVHIATATKTPTVCILGGGHFGRFLPYAPENNQCICSSIAVFNQMSCYGCNWRCEFVSIHNSRVPCVEFVDAEKILTASLDKITYSR